jgi:hypothetical protein
VSPTDAPVERAAESARAGMFLPLTLAPRVDSQRAFGVARGGYDSARRSGVLEGLADVTIIGPLAARIGVMYTQHNPSSLRPTGGLRLQALNQADHGIDAGVGVFYRAEGFTEAEGEIEGVLSFGWRLDQLGVFANLVYGQDPEARERDGEVRLSGLYELAARLQTGIDARIRFDLGSQGNKREANYDLLVGPVASYAWNNLTVLAQLGASIYDSDRTRTGIVALAGIGGAL